MYQLKAAAYFLGLVVLQAGVNAQTGNVEGADALAGVRPDREYVFMDVDAGRPEVLGVMRAEEMAGVLSATQPVAQFRGQQQEAQPQTMEDFANVIRQVTGRSGEQEANRAVEELQAQAPRQATQHSTSDAALAAQAQAPSQMTGQSARVQPAGDMEARPPVTPEVGMEVGRQFEEMPVERAEARRGMEVNEAQEPRYQAMQTLERPQENATPRLVSAVEPRMEPAVEPRMEPAVEPRMEPAVEPRMEPAVEPRMEPAVGPRMEPAVEPRLDPAQARPPSTQVPAERAAAAMSAPPAGRPALVQAQAPARVAAERAEIPATLEGAITPRQAQYQAPVQVVQQGAGVMHDSRPRAAGPATPAEPAPGLQVQAQAPVQVSAQDVESGRQQITMEGPATPAEPAPESARGRSVVASVGGRSWAAVSATPAGPAPVSQIQAQAPVQFSAQGIQPGRQLTSIGGRLLAAGPAAPVPGPGGRSWAAGPATPAEPAGRPWAAGPASPAGPAPVQQIQVQDPVQVSTQGTESGRQPTIMGGRPWAAGPAEPAPISQIQAQTPIQVSTQNAGSGRQPTTMGENSWAAGPAAPAEPAPVLQIQAQDPAVQPPRAATVEAVQRISQVQAQMPMQVAQQVATAPRSGLQAQAQAPVQGSQQLVELARPLPVAGTPGGIFYTPAVQAPGVPESASRPANMEGRQGRQQASMAPPIQQAVQREPARVAQHPMQPAVQNVPAWAPQGQIIDENRRTAARPYPPFVQRETTAVQMMPRVPAGEQPRPSGEAGEQASFQRSVPLRTEILTPTLQTATVLQPISILSGQETPFTEIQSAALAMRTASPELTGSLEGVTAMHTPTETAVPTEDGTAPATTTATSAELTDLVSAAQLPTSLFTRATGILNNITATSPTTTTTPTETNTLDLNSTTTEETTTTDANLTATESETPTTTSGADVNRPLLHLGTSFVAAGFGYACFTYL